MRSTHVPKKVNEKVIEIKFKLNIYEKLAGLLLYGIDAKMSGTRLSS